MGLKLLNSVPRKKKRKRGRKKDILKLFYKIDHFIKRGDLTPIKPSYLRRFREIRVLPESEIIYSQISKVEKLMLKALSGFTGFFEYLIYCNDFAYFDDLQVELENQGMTFKNKFVRDIIIIELARIQIGIDNYTAYMNAVRFLQAAFLKDVLHDQEYFPDVDIVSHVLRVIPLEMLKNYFNKLLEESYEFKIVKNRSLLMLVLKKLKKNYY